MKKFKMSLWLPLILFVLGAVTSCRSKVEEPQKVTLSAKALSLKVGEKATLTLNGIDERYVATWFIDKPEVASLKNGEVLALAPGKAMISVTVLCPCGKEQLLLCPLTVTEGAVSKEIAFDDHNLQSLIMKAYPDLDADKSGGLSPDEVKSVKSLLFGFETKDEIKPEQKIISLKGLEYFVALDSLDLKNQFVQDASPIFGLSKLTYLHLGNNDITTMNVSGLSNLEDLRLYGNTRLTELAFRKTPNIRELYLQNTGITTLDLTPLKELTKALINNGQLKEINFSNLPKLERIDMVKNKLQAIQAVNLPNLRELHANSNLITSVELKDVPELQRLNLYDNKLKSVDVSQAVKVMFLFLFDNPLEQIDLSKLPMLFEIRASNSSLETLDLSHNKIITKVEATNMPKLKSINLRNEGYNEEAEYEIKEGNNALERVLCDAGDEEAHLKNIFKEGSSVVIEAQ